jgi:hypothetical protein
MTDIASHLIRALGAPTTLSSLRGLAKMPEGATAESIVESSRATWGAPTTDTKG